jgi:hypothetical protein
LPDKVEDKGRDSELNNGNLPSSQCKGNVTSQRGLAIEALVADAKEVVGGKALELAAHALDPHSKAAVR